MKNEPLNYEAAIYMKGVDKPEPFEFYAEDKELAYDHANHCLRATDGAYCIMFRKKGNSKFKSISNNYENRNQPA